MKKVVKHFHLFGAIGGGAQGFNAGNARVGNLEAEFRCIGSVDVDAAANRDFMRRVGVRATTMDLFDRAQYLAFNGHEPPADWREATPLDIQRAAGFEFPHIIFLSAPCKGFSGLLSESKSLTAKYQALNRLTLRGMFLALEAFKDNLPELFVFENVPRIANRGRHLLDQIVALLRSYGYATAETTHDCGELGGLAQSRKRFLLVARHMEKVPPFLYEPEKRPLRAVGDVLGRMPLPGDPRGGPMHRIPRLQWKTWVRLAFVEAGSDWRSLNKLNVVDGHLADYLIVPEFHGGFNGVREWDRPMGTVTSRGGPSNGAFAIADPRFDQSKLWSDGQAYGVRRWRDTSGAIAGQQAPGQGAYAVADPRVNGVRHSNIYRIVRFDEVGRTVTAGSGPTAGGIAVADPRPPAGPLFGKYKCTDWGDPTGTVISGDNQGAYAVADPRAPSDGFKGEGKYKVSSFSEPAGTVISGSTTGQGAFAVADPRPGIQREKGDHYLTGGHYGVVPWASPCGAVSSAANLDNGRWSVADPRGLTAMDGEGELRMPAPADKLIAMIQSLDGTWHRPFTTLELAALQSLVDPEEYLELDGLSDAAWRERIGNAVPPAAAAAIAGVMGTTLLLAWSGQTFVLNATPIWVRPIAIALSVQGPTP